MASQGDLSVPAQRPGRNGVCRLSSFVQQSVANMSPSLGHISVAIAVEEPIKRSQRMCQELENRCPDFEGKQLKLMLYLCLVAYGSEIHDGVGADAWLRTTIKLNAKDKFEVKAGISNVPVICQACWEWLQKHEYFSITSKIEFEIRSNILPRQAYLERLQELHEEAESLYLFVEAEDFWHLCCTDRGRLHPITYINQSACVEEVPLKRKGGKCDLTIHLRPNDMQHTLPILPINPNDVVSMKNGTLGVGSSGMVSKVSWRKGTYAMKSYTPYSFTENEREYVELKILHPHLVHGVCYFTEDGARLLMEVLDSDLTRYAVENAKRVIPLLVKPIFSRAEDTFDVLLQIASAMKYLHLKNVVHGDLKPGNILLDSFEILGNGRRFLAKVTDFGDAKSINSGKDFKPAGFGTTQYAAPEHLKWRNDREGFKFDHPKQIDVYGFGAVAHEVLTGYPVYHGQRDVSSRDFKRRVITGELNPSECIKWRILKWSMRFKVWKVLGLKERFPDELMELVERCWELRPEDRPDFSNICAELEKLKFSIQTKDHGADDFSKFIAAVFVLLPLVVVCLAFFIKVVLL